MAGGVRYDHSNDRQKNESVSDGRLKRMQLDEEIANIKRNIECARMGEESGQNSRFSSPSDDGRPIGRREVSPMPDTDLIEVRNVRDCIRDRVE